MRLEALLRAHGFMRVERPPELWEADTDEAHLIPLLGEMIAASLARGGVLEELSLNAANVRVEDDGGDPSPGEYVALTVRGKVAWEADAVWLPGHPWRVAWLVSLGSRAGHQTVVRCCAVARSFSQRNSRSRRRWW